MTQTILSVAYPFARVGPEAVGGAEVVLTGLERSLAVHAYRSLVLAAEGSEVCGALLSVAATEGPITDEVRRRTTAQVQRLLDRTLETEQVALVHMHGIDFNSYRIPADVPVLVTLHLPPGWYPDSIWSLPSNYHLCCVSEMQRQSCPAHVQDRLRVIPNGVPSWPQKPGPGRHGFALMLSRICPEKNLAAGMDAARLAGVPCVLGGEVFPYEAHMRYLRDEIEPRLRQPPGRCGFAARWPGPLTGVRKRRFLQAARCVLVPSLAPETSSLLAMEALAAGTPVIAYRSGALPEIVDHGETGFLVSSVEEMAEAIGRARELDPEHCRAVARARFSFASMTGRYLAAYQALLAAHTQITEAVHA